MRYPARVYGPEGRRITLVSPNRTADGRTAYGVPWSEVWADAERWWDSRGRHLLRKNPDWVDQEVGIPSGITRGLAWAHLTADEVLRVVDTFERHHVRQRPEAREAITRFMVANRRDDLDPILLAAYLQAEASQHGDDVQVRPAEPAAAARRPPEARGDGDPGAA